MLKEKPKQQVNKIKNNLEKDGKLNKNKYLNSFIKLNSNAESAAVWRANEKDSLASQVNPKLDTSFDLLNQILAFNGWPLNGINELNLEQNGIGELRLLLPALKALQTQTVLLIAPPFLPFAPALASHNIHTKHWLVAQTEPIADRLWAAEQALLSDACAAVLCWTGRYKLNHRELRRLQLASKQGSAWFLLLRDQCCLQAPSPASLRLHLTSNALGQLNIKLIKQIGGSAGQNCTLSLAPHYENWQRLPVHLWPQTWSRNDNDNDRTITLAPKEQHANKTNALRLNNKASVVVLNPVSELQNVH